LFVETLSPYPMGTGHSSLGATKWKLEADHSHLVRSLTIPPSWRLRCVVFRRRGKPCLS
jgi:hypothetical protein